MKKIVIIAGTRPEAIKLIPLYIESKKVKRWETLLVSTGQHKEMLNSIFTFFEVKPDYDFQVMTKDQGLDQLSSRLLTECGNLFKNLKPDLVIVQGDTTTAMIAALAAFYLKIKIAHVEAGLRSYDILAPFPEEVNRRVVSIIANYHFAPTSLAASAIRKEKVFGKIFIVGNTVVDVLLMTVKKIKSKRESFIEHYGKIFIDYGDMILITGHRRESFGEGFLQICKAIQQLAASYPRIAFVYPVHLNPNVRGPVFELLTGLKNVFLIEPVSYDHMVFLMNQSKLILTDSGGVQEEAPSLGKPVVVMRDTTERPEGVKAGCSILAGTSTQRIVKITSRLLNDSKSYKKMSKTISPYGKGDSARRIVKILKENL